MVNLDGLNPQKFIKLYWKNDRLSSNTLEAIFRNPDIIGIDQIIIVMDLAMGII